MIKMGINPVLVLTPYIAVELIGAFISIYFFSKYTNTSYFYYLNQVLIKLIPVFLMSVTISFFIAFLIHEPIFRLVVIVIIPTLTVVAFSYIFVFSEDEKTVLKGIFDRILKRK